MSPNIENNEELDEKEFEKPVLIESEGKEEIIEEEQEEEKDPHSFDKLLSKFKFGKYYIRSSVIVGLGLFSEGTEAVLMSILNVIYKKELHFSPTVLSLLVSCVFFGLLVGALISGYVSDVLGRRQTMIIMLFCIYIPGFLTAFTTKPFSVFICRTMAGFFMGIFTPVVMSYYVEVTPLRERGKNMVMAGAYWVCGGIFTTFVAFCLATYIEDVNWRYLIIIVSQPILVSAVLVSLYVEESPRYLLLVKKDHEKFKESMRGIARKNESELLEEDLDKTIAWSVEKLKGTKNRNANLKDLFKVEYRTTTIVVTFIWLIEVFLYYSIFFVVPSLKGKNDQKTTTLQLLFNNAGEIFSTFLALNTIENQRFGRKHSISLGWSSSSVLLILISILLLYDQLNVWLWFLLTLARIMLSFSFSILEAFTGEVYDSRVRAMGVGLAHSACRVSGMLIAPINQYLLGIDNSAPFIFLAFVSFVGMYVLSKVDKDTKGQPIH